MDQKQLNQNQVNEPQKSSLTVIIVIVVLMLLIGGIIGWYVSKTYYPSKETVTVEKTIIPSQTQTTVVLPTSTITQPAQSSDNWKIYQNTKYGFQLTLNDDWKGYQVSEETEGNAVLLRFYIPTTDKNWSSSKVNYADPFVISIYSLDEWDKIQQEGGPQPTYINKNSQYVFGYSTWQDCPSDLCTKITEEKIKSIISTFKFIK